MDPHKPPAIPFRKNQYDTIQIFRFIAALMVIILHSTYFTSERLASGIEIYYQGANGVTLFFVISGFVMVISSESLKFKRGGWRIFSIKRIVRIVPIYWIVTTYKLFVLLFASALIYHAKINGLFILKSYFFIPAINVDGQLTPFMGVGWTLNFEMFFYLMFAIALALRANTILFMGIIFIPLSVLSFYSSPAWPDARFYANPIVLDFLYGMIAARLILNGKKLPKNIALLLIVAGLAYLFFPKMESIKGLYAHANLIIGIVAFLVIYSCASIEHLWGPKPAWLIYLGSASYSLYLIHPLVAPSVPTVLKLLKINAPVLAVTLSVVVAIVAGTAFYKFCENPLTQYLSKVVKKKKLI